jgi:23S rRNA (uracil1939-C5)-methyltransferase
MQITLGQIIKGKIDSMAFGGEGILRHEGVVVFVPFAAPGDEVAVEITEVKKSFARAMLLKLNNLSPNRVEARCWHFGMCGGCQLQHVSYEKQLQLKHEWVAQALKRIGKLDVEVAPVIGAKAKWNYRRVVKLKFEAGGPLSYVNASSNGLMPVMTCPIFDENKTLWLELNAFVKPFVAGEISLFRAGADKFVALLEVEGEAPTQLALPTFLQGCLLRTPAKTKAFGDVALSFTQHELEFAYTPLSFVQNHPEQSAKLSEQVIKDIVKSGAKSVYDLYCGFGVTAIALAKAGLQVTGVESNPESIRLAKQNAKQNNVSVAWVCDDVAKFVGVLKRDKPDVILVNPPRTGLAPKVAQALAKHKVNGIVYVSCMPQTLARDLAILAGAGYRIDSCQPYDMFPQTTHVETVVTLSLVPKQGAAHLR